MWAGLTKYYGREKAKIIMPESYDLSKEKCSIMNEKEMKCDLTLLEEKLNAKENDSVSPLVFILKNPILHSQKGFYFFYLSFFSFD